MQGFSLARKSASTRLALAFSFLFILTLFFMTALPPTSSATQDKAQSASQKRTRAEFVPGEALVRYRSERVAKLHSRQTPQMMLSAEGRQLSVQIERFEGSDLVPGLRLARVAPEDTMAAIEALSRQPDVLYAEPNYVLHLDVTPNDPRFTSGELYGLTKIGAPTAWNTTTGSNSVVVGVIDEGIDKIHPDLSANIWINPAEIAGNAVDDDGNGFIDDVNGYNFVGNTGTIPAENHATHVAGTIGAVGNNSVGVVGVNWQVGLMSLKFIADSSGSTSDAIRASNYARQMHDLWISSGGTKGANVRVLNNSYGGAEFSQSFLDAINSLNQSGLLFVAAAGNVGGTTLEPNNDLVAHYPSSYDAPNVIAVAATDSNDALASFSHFGAQSVHLGAPGVGILSTTANNTYSFFNGTSMASPHVAGAAALLLAANANLTVQQLKSLLVFNGDPVASLAGKTLTGRRLNVANSFQALAENDTTPPGTVVNLHLNSQNGRALNVGWTASGDDGAAGQASLYQVTFTDATSGTIIPLQNVIPATSGSTQAIDVKIPYRHPSGTITLREFDNVGNEGTPATLAVSVDPIVADPYITLLGSPAALSTGGTPLSLIGDDKLKSALALPFAFPFFGQNFSTVTISTNGNLFFSTPPTRSNGDADDVPSSVVSLTKFKMISGLWDDLRTDRRAGDDVYVVTPDASRIIFRWQGVTFGDGSPATEFPVNFEVELRSNGTVLTRYGAGQSAPTNTNLFPVVGISGGEPDAYSIPSHTSEQVSISLTNAQEVTFLPRVNATLTVASVNPTSGVNITVSPNDNSGFGNGTTEFTRTYYNSTVVNLTAPATASGNNFVKWQRDGADWATTTVTSITIDGNSTMTAVYVTPHTLTVASSNPASGVSITVTPNDNSNLSSGTTQFTRTYNEGVIVNLTAPSTAGNVFQKWQRDGVDFSTNPATSVTIDADRTMTAVYVNRVQFSASQFSLSESDGVAIVTVTREGLTTNSASVEYTTGDGSATQKGDYIFSSGKLNFGVGETSKTFAVLIVDDVYQEGTESLNLTLSNPVGTTLGVTNSATVAISDNDVASPTTNPLDNADAVFFVRQHYLDFLNREPDASGLAFWTNQITSCGSDTQCIEIRRINVSAAFFLSIEFQETGFLVYKMYKAAYGNLPNSPVPVRYEEFLPDTQKIALGVVVGVGNWQAQLESNKVAFAVDFVNRTRFATAYPTTLTPTLFVDALIAKAGFTPTPAERQAFIDEFGTATTTIDTAARARVVRGIAENGIFSQQEKNNAFVLTQYFGYLRRNPYDPPELTLDYAGYNFWLAKLNQFNGNFVNADMVKAFIVSGEYRNRFGP
jgi:subtilisin family serine protease